MATTATPMPQIASTQCSILIIAPNGARYAFRSADVEKTLLHVTTHKDLTEAVGSFSMEFTAIPDAEGRTWDEIIPMRSLIFISMDRKAPGLPSVKPVVMVGLTDDHGIHEDMSSRQFRRTVRISGREISCVILDTILYYNAFLATDEDVGVLDALSGTLGVHKLALTWNTNLSFAEEDPRTILERILKYFLLMGREVFRKNATVAPEKIQGLKEPLVNLDLPEEPLAVLLQVNEDQWTTFEPVTVPNPVFPAPVGSVWNYLLSFVDTHFQEFFTRVEDGVCKIHFRGKPFLHERVTSGTRFKSDVRTLETLKTLLLDDGAILTQTRQRESAHVYNFFLATPLGLLDSFKDPNFRYRIAPAIVTEHDHPSFVLRYGLRIMEAQSQYLSYFDTPAAPAQQAAAATQVPATQATAKKVTGLDVITANHQLYVPIAAQIAREEGLPEPLIPWFLGNIEQESNFNPTAHNPAPGGGDKGIAQFSPGTAAQYHLDNPFDPIASLHASARLWNDLRVLSYINNDPILIAAAYNAGPGAVRAAGGRVPNIAITQNHVRMVQKYEQKYHTPTSAPNPSAPTVPNSPPLQTPAPAAAPAPAAPAAADTATTGAPEPPMIEVAKRWSRILMAWYEYGAELFGGTLTVRGHASWNIGHRLLSADRRGPWEAYIEGVSHQYDFRTGQYLTQLRYSRGWYLSAAMAQERQHAGQTTVTATSGGPQAPPTPSDEERFAGTPIIGVRPRFE